MALFQNKKDSQADLNSDDFALLNQIEQSVREKGDTRADALQEAEQRRLEMERLNASLPKSQVPGKRSPENSKVVDESLRNDPRYKAYFDRLNRDKGVTSPSGVKPTSGKLNSDTEAPSQNHVRVGTILRLDDNSIAVYKDAVSGKDYALMYFLEPDGRLAPRGIFLENYGFETIGVIAPEYVDTVFQSARWNRDLIVFHLSHFDFVSCLDRIGRHEERETSPKGVASVASPSVSPRDNVPIADNSGATAKQGNRSLETTSRTATLERGRCFTINFGGKKWEAVFWSSDEQGPIVAHSTHGVWSLMHLDLNRFQDALEMGNLLTADELKEVEQNLASV